MREAQVAWGRIGGDTALLASPRNIGVGGPNSSKLDTLTSLRREAGIGVKISHLVGRDRRINDVSVNLVPIQTKRVYVVSDTTLQPKSNKTKAGGHWAEIAVAEDLSTYGAEGVTWNAQGGAEV